MGNSSSKAEQQQQQQQQQSGSSRQSRKECWESRDAYFACLDNANVIKPGEEGNACQSENSKYEQNCAKSWIEYFNQRRVIADAQKAQLAQAKTQSQNAVRK